MNPETCPLFLRCTADGKRFLMTTNSEASEGESRPVTVVLNWAAGLKKQARRHSERPTYNSPPGHFLVKLRRSNRQVSARRKLHRAVDAQVATANSIPWSSTAKFSRNGVLVAPLRVSYGPTRNWASGLKLTENALCVDLAWGVAVFPGHIAYPLPRCRSQIESS
jgi:hypothetical protein